MVVGFGSVKKPVLYQLLHQLTTLLRLNRASSFRVGLEHLPQLQNNTKQSKTYHLRICFILLHLTLKIRTDQWLGDVVLPKFNTSS